MRNVIFIALLLSVLYFGCNKDDAAKESPFFSFFELSGIKIDTVKMALEVWEYGFRFKPLKTGTVSQLGLKVPTIGTYKIKLYNLSTNQVLAEKTVQSIHQNEEHFVDITPVTLAEGSEFGVALVADVFFKVRNINGQSFSFPMEKGNLSIISFNEAPCGPSGCATFPNITNNSVIAPCVNLVFTPN
ncbi:MAG: hypothetical protein M3Q56_12335 [Bacteroidota bacterium]|nr:hypothetical protein [Bacteroidota bacterium]